MFIYIDVYSIIGL